MTGLPFQYKFNFYVEKEINFEYVVNFKTYQEPWELLLGAL